LARKNEHHPSPRTVAAALAGAWTVAFPAEIRRDWPFVKSGSDFVRVLNMTNLDHRAKEARNHASE
jgi:hypothetical protein